MPNFQYEVKAAGGQVTTGIIQAESLSEASDRLSSGGGYVLSVRPAALTYARVMEILRSVNVESGPGLKDVRNFTNQLAVMVKAGINIRNTLEAVADQTQSVRFRKIIEQLRSDVESGEPFSEALAKHPKVFSTLYVNMVRASEMSGNFAEMLERISAYITQQVETRSMVRGAMIYPGIIATMAVVTTIFMLTFVLPRFTALFEGKEHLLPKPTKLLMATSAFLRTYWYVLLAGLGASGAAFVYGTRTTVGRFYWDHTKLRIPLFRRMFHAIYITRGLHTMGELISAGVPMLETLNITADISGNVVYRNMWKHVHNSVNQGTRVAQPLAEMNLMPKNIVYMIAAGEQSGKLGSVMRDIAEFYTKELRSTIKAVTGMIEPAMIVLMGGVVGFIAMSIILPVFKMSSLAKER